MCLNVFVSSIQCYIMPAEYQKTRGKGEKPYPFVCFLSTPREAVRTGTSKFENVLKTVGVRNLKTKKDDKTKLVSRTMMGWPRTKKLSGAFTPMWGEGEETQFKIRTRRHPDGQLLDLSGAMLHIAIMDAKGKSEPKLVGSFTLNLAQLLKESMNQPAKETTEDGVAKKKKKKWSTTSSLKYGASDSLREVMLKRATEAAQSDDTADSPYESEQPDRTELMNQVDQELNDLNIVSLQLDEKLTDGAVEVGKIVCNLDAWWMEDTI